MVVVWIMWDFFLEIEEWKSEFLLKGKFYGDMMNIILRGFGIIDVEVG